MAETNDGAGENLVMSRKHVWRELMQRRAHACVETLAKLRVDLSERTHAAVAPPVASAAVAPLVAPAGAEAPGVAKASQSGLYEAIKLEQWMKEERREREAKVSAELKSLDDEIAAIRTKRRRLEYETKVAKVCPAECFQHLAPARHQLAFSLPAAGAALCWANVRPRKGT